MSNRQDAPQTRRIVVPLAEGFAMVGLKRSTGYRMLEEDPTFPRPIMLTPGRKGFIVSELEEWVRQRAAARPTVAGGTEIPAGYRVTS